MPIEYSALIQSGQHIVIFIPGFYGSRLRKPDAKHATWITLKTALTNQASLAMPALGFKNQQSYEASSVLDRVSIIPGLLYKDVYFKFFAQLRANLPKEYFLLPFAYDWRQSIHQSAEQLEQTIQCLLAKEVASIQVISHSMGGLLLSYYLRYGAQNILDAQENWHGAQHIDKAIIAGTPFEGTVTIFKDIFTGVQHGLNKTLTSAQSFASFPATYQLMGNYNVLTTEGIQQNYDLQVWKNLQWGLLNPNWENFSAYQLLRENTLSTYLNSAQRFSYLMASHNTEPVLRTIPLLHITGENRQTLKKAFWDETQNKLLFKVKDLKHRLGCEADKIYYQPGDGVVSSQSAKLPSGFARLFNTQHISTEASHAAIFTDKEVAAQILNFLQS